MRQPSLLLLAFALAAGSCCHAPAVAPPIYASRSTAAGGLTGRGAELGTAPITAGGTGLQAGAGTLGGTGATVGGQTSPGSASGALGGQGDAVTSQSGKAVTSTVFAWEFFSGTGYSIGSSPVATNTAGGVSGGVSTCASTCGASGTKPCCSGWQTSARTPGSVCTSITNIDWGDSGPTWIEEFNASKHSTIVAASATRPISLPALGNAIQIQSDSTDLSRIFRTLDTSAGSVACQSGLCSGGVDNAGRQMLLGATWYMRMVTQSNNALSGFWGGHLFQGLVVTQNCAQGKFGEQLQVFGRESSNNNLAVIRTTSGQAGGTAGGSHWYSSTSGTNTTIHVQVLKIESVSSATPCDTPDNGGFTVTCTANPRIRASLYIDQATETSPAIVRVLEGYKNGRGVNSFEASGTNGSTTSYKIEGICAALNYADALSCSLP